MRVHRRAILLKWNKHIVRYFLIKQIFKQIHAFLPDFDETSPAFCADDHSALLTAKKTFIFLNSNLMLEKVQSSSNEPFDPA